MIELEQLKQLIAFAKHGTLSKAAEKLYISQPALSRLIQKLEQELAEVQNLLHFRSNFTLKREDNFKNNISIPIVDNEAKITFYCICKKSIKNEIEKIFDSFSKNS